MKIFVLSQVVALEAYWSEEQTVKAQSPSMSSIMGKSQLTQSWEVPRTTRAQSTNRLRIEYLIF